MRDKEGASGCRPQAQSCCASLTEGVGCALRALQSSGWTDASLLTPGLQLSLRGAWTPVLSLLEANAEEKCALPER